MIALDKKNLSLKTSRCVPSAVEPSRTPAQLRVTRPWYSKDAGVKPVGVGLVGMSSTAGSCWSRHAAETGSVSSAP
jgi:hypothetical protein